MSEPGVAADRDFLSTTRGGASNSGSGTSPDREASAELVRAASREASKAARRRIGQGGG